MRAQCASLVVVCSLVAWTTVGCTGSEGTEEPGGSSGAGGAGDGESTLRQEYSAYFPIGAAVDSGSYGSHADLLTAHFSSITTENEMKFESLQRSEGRFTYATADQIVEFASANDLLVRGHALVWHRQNPPWLFSDGQGGDVSADVLLERMQAHISNVVTHFKGKVYAWDVVNEAIMNDGALRTAEEEAADQQSKWYAILGDAYIAEAFRTAHEADPDAKLFYNDYYNYLPEKQRGIYDMLSRLLDEDVPVHGVGLQCHLSIEPSADDSHPSYYQTVENLESAVELYSSLGLEVQVTELDVSLYVGGVIYDEASFYTSVTFTEDLQHRQADRYREFFEMFRAHRDVITGVTFWGIADDNTWLSEFSSGRTDFPLLFDTDYQPKPAYDAVIDF
ncbi:MAG: endo-1,4-beta-xylanase [Polyangiaceae bacterium]|nr:endo-1,4-beta-xylanase [Polyangiaceae bacterium]